jgi:hypothetical protein
MAELSSLVPELTQPLTAVLTNAQVALRSLNGDSPDWDVLREIMDDLVAQTLRTSEVVARMRSLARRGACELRASPQDDS